MSHLSFLHDYAIPGKHFDPVKAGEDAVNSDSWPVRSHYARQDYITPEHLECLLQDSNVHVVKHAVRNSKITSDQLDSMQEHPNYQVRHAVMDNPNVKEHHLDKAIKDESVDVRWTAATHHKATPKQLQSALYDPEQSVVIGAIYNKKTPSSMIHPLMNSSDSSISNAAGHELWRRGEIPSYDAV